MEPPPNRQRQRAIAVDELTTVSCHENEIPEFAAAEIDRCFGSLLASIAQLQQTGRLTELTSTYIVRVHDEITTVLLFEREGDKITVLNELIKIEQDEIVRFVNYIFSRYASVMQISFFGVDTGRGQIAYPHQRFFCAEEMVISSPGTPQEYFKNIGKSTRKTIKRRCGEIASAHPTHNYQVVAPKTANDELVRTIIDFNRVRMSNKSKVSGYRDEDTMRIATLASHDGLAGVVTIAGKTCAGSVCCKVGANYFMLVSGHDPSYDAWSLGMLCCYWTAAECIRRGAVEINLMHGRLPYKYSLLCRPRKYDLLAIYRTRAHFYRNIKALAQTALAGYILEAKFALLECERKDGFPARMVTKALHVFRVAKRSIAVVRLKLRRGL